MFFIKKSDGSLLLVCGHGQSRSHLPSNEEEPDKAGGSLGGIPGGF